MPQTSSATQQSSDQPLAAALAERRVDGPHAVNRPLELVSREEPPSSPEALQLEQHAEQLAEYLRQQQREIDRRESQVNACFATWEQEQRIGRLRLDERAHELNERELQLAQREADFSLRATALARAESVARQATESAERREKQVQQREQKVEQLQQQVRESEQKIQAAQQKWQQQMATEHQQLQARRAELYQFRRHMLQNLEYHRAALAEREEAPAPSVRHAPVPASKPATNAPAGTDLKRQWRALEQEREMWQAERDLQKHEFQQWAAAQRAQLEERAEKLNKQRESLQNMYRWLASARQDALRLHGHTLEMRLAAQQTWENVATAADSPEFRRVTEQIRGELSDYYAAQRSEAEQLLQKTQQAAEKLDQRQQRFENSRTKWHSWVSEQRKKLEAKSVQIAARQQQLDSQQARLRRLEVELFLQRDKLAGLPQQRHQETKTEPNEGSAP